MHDQEQLEKVRHGKGFIAALDQSGGSTPKALSSTASSEDAYSNDERDVRPDARDADAGSSPARLHRRAGPRRDPVREDHGPRGRGQGHRRLPVVGQGASCRSSRSTRAWPTRPTASR